MRRLISLAPMVPVLLISLAILLLASCTPTWLPDSSGFLFAKTNGAIVHYDLASKSAREIAPAVPRGLPVSYVLATSPDKERVAIARLLRKEADGVALRFEVYQTAGEEPGVRLEQSDEIVVAKYPQKQYVMFCSCYWSPDGKRLLGVVPGAGQCFSYVLGDAKPKAYEGISPLFSPAANNSSLNNPFTFMADPMLRDSSGFLAAADGKLVVQPWDKPFVEMDHAELKKVESIRPGQSSVFMMPIWESSKLRFWIGSQAILVDPVEKRISVQEDARAKRLEQYAQEKAVRVLMEFENGSVIQLANDKQVQFWKRDREETINLPNAVQDDAVFVLPSPDGEKALVYSFGPNAQVLAVDKDGKLLASVLANKP